MPALPNRIECYDISNTQGTNSVASMVVFQDGKPLKDHYRRFKIKTVEGANDFASLQEVIRRRFRRSGALGNAARGLASSDDAAEEAIAQFNESSPLKEEPGSEASRAKEDGSFISLPDLVLIDGGRGQLNAVAEVMRMELGLHDIPLASLAKREEEIFMPEMAESIMLPRTSPALYLVQRARDEAHRFAITFHRGLRQKKGMESMLDAVPGIGPRRKRMLMRHFGSLDAIREATIDDLAAAPGMTGRLAERVKEYV